MAVNSNRHFIILVFLSGFVSACVSVKVGDTSVRRAEGVQARAPGGAFKAFTASHVDQAWKNARNGNSISYLSDCSANNDPSLMTITRGILQDFHDHEVVESKELMYNGRQALHSVVTGTVDGIPSKFDVMVFKKNNCIYVLSYVAVLQTYEHDRAAFERFLQGFKAP